MFAEIQSVFNVNNWLVHDRFIIASRSDLAQFKFIWNWWHLKNCCVVKCSWQQGKLMMIIRIYDQQHFITTVVITMMTAMTLMTMDIMRMRTVIMISNVMTLWFSYRMVSLNCKRIQQFSSSSHIHHCHGHCWSVVNLDNHHQHYSAQQIFQVAPIACKYLIGANSASRSPIEEVKNWWESNKKCISLGVW